MTKSLAGQVMQRISQVAALYHRLVILAAPAGAEKTAALRGVHKRTGAPLFNLLRHGLDDELVDAAC